MVVVTWERSSLKAKLRHIISSRYFRLAVGLFVSVFALYFASRGIKFDDVWRAISKVNIVFVVWTLVSVMINVLSKAFRWQVLISSSDPQISFLDILVALLVGQVLNLFVPGRAGDLGRVYLLGQRGFSRTFVLGTVVLEKMLDLIVYALLFLILLFLMPLPTWVGQSPYTLVGIASFVLLGLILIIIYRNALAPMMEMLVKSLPKSLQKRMEPRIHSGLSSLAALQNRDDFLKLSFWSALIWATALLNNYLMLLAFDIHLPITACILTLIVVQAGISVSNVPATIGVFEYLCALSLSTFGIERMAALSYGVLLHAVVISLPLVSGVLSIFWVGLQNERFEYRQLLNVKRE